MPVSAVISRHTESFPVMSHSPRTGILCNSSSGIRLFVINCVRLLFPWNIRAHMEHTEACFSRISYPGFGNSLAVLQRGALRWCSVLQVKDALWKQLMDWIHNDWDGTFIISSISVLHTEYNLPECCFGGNPVWEMRNSLKTHIRWKCQAWYHRLFSEQVPPRWWEKNWHLLLEVPSFLNVSLQCGHPALPDILVKMATEA